MSLLDRRLHLLLDQRRYDLVAAEAARTGQSVAAVIRDAIDLRLDAAQLETEAQSRARAAAALLARADEQTGAEPSWEQRLSDQAADLDQMLR